VLTKQVIDALIDVQLLDQELQQARRPAKRPRSPSCCPECFRPPVAAPTFVRDLGRRRRSCRARLRTRAS
jgi:hypothetical protein